MPTAQQKHYRIRGKMQIHEIPTEKNPYFIGFTIVDEKYVAVARERGWGGAPFSSHSIIFFPSDGKTNVLATFRTPSGGGGRGEPLNVLFLGEKRDFNKISINISSVL
jgi:hypothetical protein